MTYAVNSPALAPVSRMLPQGAMVAFVKGANLARGSGGDHNTCIVAGWAEVKKHWQPGEAGRWVAKDDPGAGDVHVDVPMGEAKPKKKPKPGDGFATDAGVAKVDDALGLVFGWAIVSTENGEPYFDVQGDHIPEAAMMKAAADFMAHSRVAKDMHVGDAIGDVVFAWPMTADVAKALGIETTKTGLLIGMRPAEDVLGKFRDGTYTGFSIGGSRGLDEEVE